MCKVLMVENRPVIVSGLSYVINNVLQNVELKVAKSFKEMEKTLNVGDYEMLFLCLPFTGQTQINKLLDIAQKNVSTAILILSENIDNLPMQKLYSAGIRGILGTGAGMDEICKAIVQVSADNLYISRDFMKRFIKPDWRGTAFFKRAI